MSFCGKAIKSTASLVWPVQPSGTGKENMVHPESFLCTYSVINLQGTNLSLLTREALEEYKFTASLVTREALDLHSAIPPSSRGMHWIYTLPVLSWSGGRDWRVQFQCFPAHQGSTGFKLFNPSLVTRDALDLYYVNPSLIRMVGLSVRGSLVN